MNTPRTRRQFLGHAGCAAMSALPILNTLLNLRLAGSIANAAPPAPGEYRALVCLFQSGGNDTFNVLVPHGGASSTNPSAYAEYAASRANLALAQASLHQITPLNTPGRTFGVHPSMPQLAALFEAGKAAFVANVGTLIEPVQNRAQVEAATKRLPLGLYSHSDQIEQWQTSVPHSRSGVGWAGRMMDLLKDLNSNQAVSMNISMDGSNVFQTGTTGAEYAVSPGSDNDPTGGATALAGYDADYDVNNGVTNATSAAVDSQLALQYTNLLQQSFQQKRRTAQDAYAVYSAATAGTLPGTVTFPNTSLGRQLRQVALALMGRVALGAVRQTFFVNRGGWDHHSDTLPLQLGMLGEVDAAVSAFWQQLVALGIENQVTLFSASDFGRTLTSNDQGSDHAWGGNHFVVGGSVVGRKIYGSYPSLAVNPDSGAEVNPLDTGRGRLIPTTSCDEFFAEMALWLGVPAGSLPLVLPNIGNFYAGGGTPPLGFLGA
jgi:uncharacterized protein (DUF1501 family)